MRRFLESGNPWAISLMVIYVVLLTLSLTAIGLRIWARRLKKIRLRLNDWAVMVAWFLSLGLLAIGLCALIIGGGANHIRYTTIPEIITLLKLFVAGQMVWAAANTAVKISILDLYIQIFRNRSFRIVSYVLMAVSGGYLIMVVLEAFFLCKPFAYSWNKLRKGKCGNQHDVYLSSGIVNLIIDIMIIILPMPMLWGLQLGLAKKLALTFIFGIGALICVVTTFRLVELARLDLDDVTYNLAKVALWTGMEPMFGVVNACLPVIQPVIKTVLESNIFSRWSRSSTNTKAWTNSSSSKSGRRSTPGNINSFHRLDESPYPLTSVVGTQTQISSGPGTQDFATTSADDLEAQDHEHKQRSNSTAINVRTDWEVQTAPLAPQRR